MLNNNQNNKNHLVSSSQSNKPFVFFERTLSNNLDFLSKYLLGEYERISESRIISGDLEKEKFKETGSISTMNWYQYNVFQFYNLPINNLFWAVRDMAIEACEYYDIDYFEEKYYIQGWFNVNYKDNGKLGWHLHDTVGAPRFSGYYCVNAEPSTVEHLVFDEYITKENINNNAILFETGHPHSMNDWDWDGPRITIAYDVVPLKSIVKEWEQHWIPL